MAHSRKPKDRRRQLLFLAPVLGALVVVAALALSISQSSQVAVVDFRSNLIIEVHDSTNETLVRCVYPHNDVGVPGGLWVPQQYDKYGLDGDSPVYAILPLSVNCPVALPIYVRSTVARNYTLGDFFAEWGQPLGPNNTIGLQPSGGLTWVMCVGPSVSQLQPGNWGQEVLRDNSTMIVTYTATSGCS